MIEDEENRDIYHSLYVEKLEASDTGWLEHFKEIPPELERHIARCHNDSHVILYVEDDVYAAKDYRMSLEAEGLSIIHVSNADDALRIIWETSINIWAIVLDIRMNTGEYFSSFETADGSRLGNELAIECRNYRSRVLFIALSNSHNALDESLFKEKFKGWYCNKNEYHPDKFANFVRLKLMKDFSKIKSFIVHGHDTESALSLKNFLQNRLNFKEPVILSEMPNLGLSVIEKLEKNATDVDIVFSLFTPDDFLSDGEKQARSNVIFEFGYFLGQLGRTSGKVIMLYKKGTLIPSDLKGLVYIDITNGIESSGESIRKEIEALFLK